MGVAVDLAFAFLTHITALSIATLIDCSQLQMPYANVRGVGPFDLSRSRSGRFRDCDLLRKLFETVVRRCMAEGLIDGLPLLSMPA
jgi:hypothetical protein